MPRNNAVFDKIGVENFKAFGALQRVRLKPITLLYGKNSSGKSSFIQSLLYLKSVFSTGSYDLKDTRFGNFGGFDRFIYGQKKGVTLAFQIEIQDEYIPDFTVRLEIGRDTSSVSQSVKLQKVEYLDFDEEPFITLEKNKSNRYTLKFEPSSESVTKLVDESGDRLSGVLDFFECVFTDNFLMPDRVITSLGKKPNEVSEKLREEIETFLGRISAEFTSFFSNISYLCGNRAVVDKGVLDGSFSLSDEEDSGGLYYWEQIRRNSDLRNKVNEYLALLFPVSIESPTARYEIVAEELYTFEAASEVAGDVRQFFDEVPSEIRGEALDYVSEIEGDFDSTDSDDTSDATEFTKQFKRSLYGKGARTEIRIRDLTNGLRLLPNELGFGVGQVIPIVAAACLPGRTVIVEQPETHLHPKQQADLGEILVNNAALNAENGSDGSSFIIETHSIHMLERLGKIIRETSRGSSFKGLVLDPQEVGINYVDSTNGNTVGADLIGLGLLDDGTLDPQFPEGFFNEDMNDLF